MPNTWRPDRPDNPTPMSLAIECIARPDQDIEHLLGKAGPIAAALPNWEDRPDQRRMANVIRRAWKQRRHAITEAGTGAGKSHASLVPAILHALETNKPVVVSTKTNTLLDQLVDKDLPFLLEALTPWLQQRFGRTFTFAKLKGLAQWLCEKKFAKMDDPGEDLQAWRDTTTDGDLAGLPFVPEPRMRRAITAERTECSGKRCKLVESCWYYAARRAAWGADLIVVNHALLMRSLLSDPGTVLPIYDACVIDEAHHLLDEATCARALEFTGAAVRKMAKQALDFCGGQTQGMLAEETRIFGEPTAPENSKACTWCETITDQHHEACPYGPDGELAQERRNAPPTLEAIDHELAGFLRALEHRLRPSGDNGTALLKPEHIQGTAAYEHLQELGRQLQRLHREVRNAGEWHAQESQDRAEADALGRSLFDMLGVLKSIRDGRPGHVSWLQAGQHTSIHSQPLDAVEFLKDSLWKVPCALSSATLATSTDPNTNFDYTKESLGVHTMHTVQLASPFRWNEQALIYLPEEGLHEGLLRDRSRENAQTYARVSALHVKEVANLTKGRLWWLFTSQASLRLALEHCRDLPFPFLAQGEMGPAETLNWFRNTPGAVLFALASFWEGADVAGDALSCVVIDRIPFPTPDDLLHEARKNAIGGGRRAFQELSVPLAVTKLRQGFGRLIRTATDRGLCVLLDPRLRGKHAGLLEMLPPARRITRAQLPQLPFFLAGAGERVPGDPTGLLALDTAGMEPLHARYVERLRGMLPLLTPQYWGLAQKLVARYGKETP